MKRGNQTVYEKSSTEDRSFEDRRLDEQYCKQLWQKAVERDPLKVSYDALKDFIFPDSGSPNCQSILKTLEMLAFVTGDGVFLAASSAMKEHGLTSGGIKKAASELLKRRGAEWLVVPHMSRWTATGLSKREAAFRTAAQYGVVGASWESVIDRLEKAYDELVLMAGSVEQKPSREDSQDTR